MFNIIKKLLMTGFDPQTSCIGGDCSTNRVTTTAHRLNKLIYFKLTIPT